MDNANEKFAALSTDEQIAIITEQAEALEELDTGAEVDALDLEAMAAHYARTGEYCEIINGLEDLLEVCIVEARKQGWSGDDGEFEFAAVDLEWVTDAFGRLPTQEEWEAAGLAWVGGAHIGPSEYEHGDVLVYWDTQDPANEGWAWRDFATGESGAIDSEEELRQRAGL